MSIESFPENQKWPDKSIRSRFTVSIIANIFRGGLSFLTGVIIARGLGPEVYGDYIFLIGSFVAILTILDLGTSNAFYTFISQRTRGRRFINIYRSWQFIQFLLPLIIIGVLFPDAWITAIWSGENRALVILSFAAVFLQQSAWKTVIHIGESHRITQKIQVFWLSLVVVHFVLIVVCWLWEALSLVLLFGILIVEYLLGLLLAEKVLGLRSLEGIPVELKSTFHEYAVFCAPFVLYSFVSFAQGFCDRWFLQNFGGAIEQAYFGVSFQFTVLCGLFTISIQKIFWKEIAEAQEKQNIERVRDLYIKVSRLLFTLSALLSGFLIPWSQEIIQVLLGDSYLGGVWVWTIMLLYPAYQSLGQITTLLYFALQKTKEQANFAIAFKVLHILATYFVLAPEDARLPGLDLGSLGIALNIVIIAIISVNTQVWWISRNNGWRYDWRYQMTVLSLSLGSGWACREMLIGLGGFSYMNFYIQFGMTLLLYFSLVGWFIWKIPHLAGMTREDIRSFLKQITRTFKLRA